jgi:hypothetical protein
MPQRLTEIGKQHEGQRLDFLDGEFAEVAIDEVALPNTCVRSPESWGLLYDLISTNRLRVLFTGAAPWSRLDQIGSFEVLGDPIA